LLMKSLLLTTFFLSLLFITALAWSKEFGNFQLIKDDNQSLCREKQNFCVRTKMDFNIYNNSIRGFYAQETTSIDTLRFGLRTNKGIKKRSATAAFLIALVPGSVAHGTGHFYAGKLKTGFVLLGSELVGIGLFMGGALGGFAGNEGNNRLETIGFVGFSLFMFSWFYDMINAPLEVKKQNQKLLQNGKRLNGRECFKPYLFL
jgi:hypothetical protein